MRRLVILALLLSVSACSDDKKSTHQQICYSASDCPTQAYVCDDGLCRLGGTECAAATECISPAVCTSQDGAECRGGFCYYPELVCDDGVACTEDVCEPARSCVHTPVDSLCDDSDDQTIDACDVTIGCVYEAVPDAVAPTITGTTPDADAGGFQATDPIQIRFSEAMAAGSLSNESVVVRAGTPPATVFDQVLTYGGHTYAILRDARDWQRADALATYYGGHLVSIGDATENAFLNSNYDTTTYGATWIGLNDLDVAGTWKWTDGDAVWTNWWVSGGATGDCATLARPDGTWARAVCTNAKQAVVEWERVAGTVSLQSASVVQFVPTVPFHLGLSYEVTVTTALTDVAGNALAAGTSFKFSTLAPRYAYVANDGGQSISTLEIQAESGLPRHRGYVTTSPPSAFLRVAATSSGRFVYGATPGSLRIHAYQADARGNLAAVGDGVILAVAPTALAVAPDNGHLYVIERSGNLVSIYAINGTTGALTGGTTLTSNSPSDVLVHPNNNVVYVLNADAKTVSIYTRQATSGALTYVSAVATGANPTHMVMHPNRRVLYVNNVNDRTLSAYAVNASGGQLTVVGSPVANDGYACMTIDPAGRFLYTGDPINDKVLWFSLDATTGVPTLASSAAVTGNYLRTIKLDPTGLRAYVGPNPTERSFDLYDVNPRTGALLVDSVVKVLTHARPSDIVFATGATPLSHKLKLAYVPQAGTVNAVLSYQVDPEVGSLGTSSGTPVATGLTPFCAALDPKQRFLYVVNNGDNTISSYVIGSDGSLSANPAVATSTLPRAVDVDPTGRFVYVVGGSESVVSGKIDVYSVNQTTGVLTPGTSQNTDIFPTSVAVDAAGRLVFVTNVYNRIVLAYAIDITTGALPAYPGNPTDATDVRKLILPVCDGNSNSASPTWIAAHPIGPYVIVVGNSSVYLERYYPDEGSLTHVYCAGINSGDAHGAVVHPSGRQVYTAGWGDSHVTTLSLHPELGGASSIVGLTPFIAATSFGLTAEPSGRFVYMAGDSTYSDSLQAYLVRPTSSLTVINKQSSSKGRSIIITSDVQ